MLHLLSKNVYSMNLEELETLLLHYETHEEKYLYETKINSIKRAIAKQNKPAAEPEWMALAREDIATKKKWRELGAISKDSGTMQMWYYAGEQFYMWISGESVYDSTPRLRAADKKLDELIKREEVDAQ